MRKADQKIVAGLWAPVSRSFIALLILTTMAYSIHNPFTEAKLGHFNFKFKFHLSFLWAVMTNFFIVAPKVGSVAKVGAQHVLGTLLGSVTGVGIVLAATHSNGFLMNSIWYTLCMSLSGILANLLGWYLKTPGTSMLFVISCILIVFATESQGSAIMFYDTRIFGMIGGVILCQILAVVVFPVAATQEVVSKLAEVLEHLAALNDTAWEHAGIQAAKADKSGKKASRWTQLSRHRSTILRMRDQANWLQNPRRADEKGFIKLTARKEGSPVFVQTMVTLRLEAALMEIYKGLDELDSAIPLTRTEIAVELFKGRWVFLPGLSIFQRVPLPEQNISDVAWSVRKCARVLWTLHLSFQNGIDEEMADILKQQYPRDMIKSLKDAAHNAFWDMVDAYPSGTEVRKTGVTQFETGVQALFAINDYQRRRVSEHFRKYKNMALLNEADNNPSVLRLSRKADMLRSVTQPSTRWERAIASVLSKKDEEVDEVCAKLLTESSANTSPNLERPQSLPAADYMEFAGASSNGMESQPVNGEPEDNPPLGPREYNRNDSKEAIARLSKGVEVMQGGEVMTSGVARSSMDMKLEIPDVPSEDLKMFPDTPEGYVSMVRWYSLQFLLEELSRGLSELAENLETLLQNMPSYGVKM